jgi:hypothetical protein
VLHGLRIAILGDGDVVLGGSHVDAGGVEVHRLQTGRQAASPAESQR